MTLDKTVDILPVFFVAVSFIMCYMHVYLQGATQVLMLYV